MARNRDKSEDPDHAMKDQRGVALIIVLWILSLMTIMAGSYSLSTKRESENLRHAHERIKQKALAASALNYAMMMLSLPNEKKRWPSDGQPRVWQLGDASAEITVVDEGSKIDLNAAQDKTLQTILELVLQDRNLAMTLTDTILDWKDPDDIKRPHGAESADYRALDLKNVPQNRNFLILDELKSVKGVTREVLQQLSPWFTIYTGQDGINPLKASFRQLMMLSRGNKPLVEEYLSKRTMTPPPNFPPVMGLNFTSVSDLAYTIITRTEIIDQDIALETSTTVNRTSSSDGIPFSVLAWKEHFYPRKNSLPPMNPLRVQPLN